MELFSGKIPSVPLHFAGRLLMSVTIDKLFKLFSVNGSQLLLIPWSSYLFSIKYCARALLAGKEKEIESVNSEPLSQLLLKLFYSYVV